MKINHQAFSFFKRLNQFQKFVKRFFSLFVEIPLTCLLVVLVFYLVFTASTNLRLARQTAKATEKVQKGMVNSYAVIALLDGSFRYIPDWRIPIPISDNGGVCKPSTAWIVKSWGTEITIPFTHALSVTPCEGTPPEDMKPFLYAPPVHVNPPHTLVAPTTQPPKLSISSR